jgi:hypothetical protein
MIPRSIFSISIEFNLTTQQFHMSADDDDFNGNAGGQGPIDVDLVDAEIDGCEDPLPSSTMSESISMSVSASEPVISSSQPPAQPAKGRRVDYVAETSRAISSVRTAEENALSAGEWAVLDGFEALSLSARALYLQLIQRKPGVAVKLATLKYYHIQDVPAAVDELCTACLSEKGAESRKSAEAKDCPFATYDIGMDQLLAVANRADLASVTGNMKTTGMVRNSL